MSTSAAQLAANRLNAQHSTGPRTDSGKLKVAANAVKHGLSGAHLIILGEDPAEYDALLADFRADLHPSGITESLLVEQIAQAQWKLKRIAQMEIRLFAPSSELLNNLPAGTDPLNIAAHLFYNDSDANQSILKLSRYESAARRAYNQALKQLLQLQALRRKLIKELAKAPSPQPVTRNYKTNPIPPADSPRFRSAFSLETDHHSPRKPISVLP
ncbi:MAG: hypothetical protein FJW20_27205 [Acidimicrobiia bacterium]|nr:hypothetical protein [Acidimicrobiia bacterium]